MKQFPLSTINEGEEAWVVAVECEKAMRIRLNDLGLIEGSRIQYLFPSVFGDPKAYLVRGAVLGIRNQDAEKIVVRREQ